MREDRERPKFNEIGWQSLVTAICVCNCGKLNIVRNIHFNQFSSANGAVKWKITLNFQTCLEGEIKIRFDDQENRSYNYIHPLNNIQKYKRLMSEVTQYQHGGAFI